MGADVVPTCQRHPGTSIYDHNPVINHRFIQLANTLSEDSSYSLGQFEGYACGRRDGGLITPLVDTRDVIVSERDRSNGGKRT